MSEGRALTNAIGNSVATMVIAGWQGERDDERFQAVLAEPSIVDREVEAALRGEDEDEARERAARGRALRARGRRARRSTPGAADARAPTPAAASRRVGRRPGGYPHRGCGACRTAASPGASIARRRRALGRCPSAMSRPSTQRRPARRRRRPRDPLARRWRAAPTPRRSGGKAASLSRLAARHRVPPGLRRRARRPRRSTAACGARCRRVPRAGGA